METVRGKRPGTTIMTGQINVNGEKPRAIGENGVNGMKEENGEQKENGENGVEHVAWKIWDRECWFIPETGELFTDYEYV